MESKYYLAVEINPNNYFPINLKDISLANYDINYDLESIDNFTVKYSINEIKEAINKANILSVNDTMPLVVIYYEKNVVRKTDVLTKEYIYDMTQFIKTNFNNKDFINKIYNFLNNKLKVEDSNLKKPTDYLEYIKTINNLPYNIKRKLYFYLYGML